MGSARGPFRYACCTNLRALLMRKQRYLMVVNLVKRHPVEELVSKLKSGKTIVKEQVIRESTLLESQKPICLLIEYYEQ